MDIFIRRIISKEFKKEDEKAVYELFMSLRKWSLFFETSSSHCSLVYPCTSIPCFFAFSNNSSSVSPYMICVHTGSPASRAPPFVTPIRKWIIQPEHPTSVFVTFAIFCCCFYCGCRFWYFEFHVCILLIWIAETEVVFLTWNYNEYPLSYFTISLCVWYANLNLDSYVGLYIPDGTFYVFLLKHDVLVLYNLITLFYFWIGYLSLLIWASFFIANHNWHLNNQK